MVRLAGHHGERWAELSNGQWCPAQSLVWPRELAAGMLGWAEGRRGADDGMIGQYLRQTRQRALVTIPNLVEHPDEPSLISRSQRGGNPQRMSCCQPEADCDPARLDWA